MSKKDYIFLFDVNHTLINTASYHTLALPLIEEFLSKFIDKDAAVYITKRFNELFLLMVAGFLYSTKTEWGSVKGGKKSYQDLITLISKHQVMVQKEWGFIKKWSREVLLKIAADEIRVHLSTDLITNTATLYWDTITVLSKPFDDACDLFKFLHQKGYPIYLLTSSDGRLQIKDGHFTYDASFSGNYKQTRIQTLNSKGLFSKGIIVGDPEDKPSLTFFRRAVKTIETDLAKEIQSDSLVIVGNSYADDLAIPITALHFGKAILINYAATEIAHDKNFYTINNLLQVKDLLNL